MTAFNESIGQMAKSKTARRSVMFLAAATAFACLGAAPASAHSDVRIGVDIGDRHEYSERGYEERQTRVWVPPVYRTVTDRVWVEPLTQTVTERVWVPDCVEDREVVHNERHHRVVEHVRVVVTPGHYEDCTRQAEVTPGHWQDVQRQELCSEGHWEVRTERVPVTVERPAYQSFFHFSLGR